MKNILILFSICALFFSCSISEPKITISSDLEKKLHLSNPKNPYGEGGWYQHTNAVYFTLDRSVILSMSMGSDCVNIHSKSICLPLAAKYPLTLIHATPTSLSYVMGKNTDAEGFSEHVKHFENKKLHIEFVNDKTIMATFDIIKMELEYLTKDELIDEEGYEE